MSRGLRVRRVEFRIDDNPEGIRGVAADTRYAAPFLYAGIPSGLDTTFLTNGPHRLTTTLVENSGRKTTRTTTVTVANPPAVAAAAVAPAAAAPAPSAPTTTAVATTTQPAPPKKAPVEEPATPEPTPTTPPSATPETTPAPAGSLGTGLPARMPESSGSGGTFYVDGTNGNDANAGTSAAPWKTINKALGTVPLAGSIIRVKPGTYASSGTSYAIVFRRAGSPSDPVTLRADTPGTVTITNANQSAWTLGAWVSGASGLRIQDITFRVTTSAGANVGSDAILIENSDRIEVYRCTINEVGTIGLMVRGGTTEGSSADDVWVLGNTFRPSGSNVYGRTAGSGWSSDQYYGSKGSHGIYAGQTGDSAQQSMTSGSTRLVIANNVFAGSPSGRHVQLGPQARSSYVVNNTFFGNHIATQLGWSSDARYAGGGIELFANVGGASYATQKTIIQNNLFVDLDGHGVYGSGPSLSGNVVSNNMAFNLENGAGNQGSSTKSFEPNYGGAVLFSEGTNWQNTDPLLSSPSSYDFRLRSGSPAIGKASAEYSMPFDLNGNARDAAPDLGAYEG